MEQLLDKDKRVFLSRRGFLKAAAAGAFVLAGCLGGAATAAESLPRSSATGPVDDLIGPLAADAAGVGEATTAVASLDEAADPAGAASVAGEEGGTLEELLPPEAMLSPLPGYDGRYSPMARATYPRDEDAPRIYMPEGRICIRSVKTGEKVDVLYRNTRGEYDQEALDRISRLLRCPMTHEVKDIDPRTIEFLSAIDRQFGGDNEFQVISGYRSRKYNDWLKKHSRVRRRVSWTSLHIEGMAVDFTIPNLKLKKLKSAAIEMNFGGVGYYPRAHFIHVDSGRVRHW